jgi:hypothetical protein
MPGQALAPLEKTTNFVEQFLKVIQTRCFSPGDDLPTEMQRWDQGSQDIPHPGWQCSAAQ